MVAVCVKDVDLGVVESDDNVLLRQVEAGDHTLIWRNLAGLAVTAHSPGRVYHVLLLEVRAVGCDFRSSPERLSLCSAVQALGPQALYGGAGSKKRDVERGGISHGRVLAPAEVCGCAAVLQPLLGRLRVEAIHVFVRYRLSLREAAVRVLAAEQLPGGVVVHQVVPSLRYLRGARERRGVIDAFEDLWSREYGRATSVCGYPLLGTAPWVGP